MVADKRIGLAELKALEFELLSFLADLCEEHELRYYLAYGTLLGAVRHGGFIPWDDDIDVVMPRADYLQLISIIEQGDFKNIRILSLQNEVDYCYPFAKLIDTRTVLIENYNQIEKVPLGVNIDIFPLEGLPDHRFQSNLLYLKLIMLRKMRDLSNQKLPPNGRNGLIRLLKIIPALLLKMAGCKRIIWKMDQLAGKLDFDSSQYVGSTVWANGTKEWMPRAYFCRAKQLAFEGRLFPAPTDYDGYLREIYGDYMQLPPEEERVSIHRMEAFWK